MLPERAAANCHMEVEAMLVGVSGWFCCGRWGEREGEWREAGGEMGGGGGVGRGGDGGSEGGWRWGEGRGDGFWGGAKARKADRRGVVGLRGEFGGVEEWLDRFGKVVEG